MKTVRNRQEALNFFMGNRTESVCCDRADGTRATVDNFKDAEKFFENPNQESVHPSVAHIMKYFKFEHLPTKLQDVSRPFCELAHVMAYTYPQNPETTAGLRKLLEAKDCAVRAHV